MERLHQPTAHELRQQREEAERLEKAREEMLERQRNEERRKQELVTRAATIIATAGMPGAREFRAEQERREEERRAQELLEQEQREAEERRRREEEDRREREEEERRQREERRQQLKSRAATIVANAPSWEQTLQQQLRQHDHATAGLLDPDDSAAVTKRRESETSRALSLRRRPLMVQIDDASDSNIVTVASPATGSARTPWQGAGATERSPRSTLVATAAFASAQSVMAGAKSPGSISRGATRSFGASAAPPPSAAFLPPKSPAAPIWGAGAVSARESQEAHWQDVSRLEAIRSPKGAQLSSSSGGCSTRNLHGQQRQSFHGQQGEPLVVSPRPPFAAAAPADAPRTQIDLNESPSSSSPPSPLPLSPSPHPLLRHPFSPHSPSPHSPSPHSPSQGAEKPYGTSPTPPAFQGASRKKDSRPPLSPTCIPPHASPTGPASKAWHTYPRSKSSAEADDSPREGKSPEPEYFLDREGIAVGMGCSRKQAEGASSSPGNQRSPSNEGSECSPVNTAAGGDGKARVGSETVARRALVKHASSAAERRRGNSLGVGAGDAAGDGSGRGGGSCRHRRAATWTEPEELSPGGREDGGDGGSPAVTGEAAANAEGSGRWEARSEARSEARLGRLAANSAADAGAGAASDPVAREADAEADERGQWEEAELQIRTRFFKASHNRLFSLAAKGLSSFSKLLAAASAAAAGAAAGMGVGGVGVNVLGGAFGEVEERYEVEGGKELGAGQFGVTRVVVCRSTGRRLACKTINKAAFKSKSDIEDVRREVAILNLLRSHPNVIHLEEPIETPHAIHLIMELCSGGELFDRIKERRRYSEREAALVMRAVLGVLQSCHQRHHVVHRDIKPENILLAHPSSPTDVRVIDFGVAAFLKPGGKMLTDVVGSLFYIAPEVLSGSYGTPADVWSAGVVLYVLLAGVPPFWAETEAGVARAIKEAEVGFKGSAWRGVSEKGKDLILRMLDRDQKRRVSAQEALGGFWSYRPFFGPLANCHVETIFAAVARSLPAVRFRRECLRMVDGGTVALDWPIGGEALEGTSANGEVPPGTPWLILLPRLTGGSGDTCMEHMHMSPFPLRACTIDEPGLTGDSGDTYVRHMLVRARRPGGRGGRGGAQRCSTPGAAGAASALTVHAPLPSLIYPPARAHRRQRRHVREAHAGARQAGGVGHGGVQLAWLLQQPRYVAAGDSSAHDDGPVPLSTISLTIFTAHLSPLLPPLPFPPLYPPTPISPQFYSASFTEDERQFYSASFTEDLRQVVRHVAALQPLSRLYAAGWSLGANILVRYLAQEGEEVPLSGAVSLCNPFDLVLADRNFHIGFNNFYDQRLGSTLRGIYANHAPLFEGLGGEYDIDLVARAKTVRDFDVGLTRGAWGWRATGPTRGAWGWRATGTTRGAWGRGGESGVMYAAAGLQRHRGLHETLMWGSHEVCGGGLGYKFTVTQGLIVQGSHEVRGGGQQGSHEVRGGGQQGSHEVRGGGQQGSHEVRGGGQQGSHEVRGGGQQGSHEVRGGGQQGSHEVRGGGQQGSHEVRGGGQQGSHEVRGGGQQGSHEVHGVGLGRVE
ncbi:unnamed protein product [Closterium sp. NIES-65]|nr:unnamed protein product [Closterium sp. NIES-65]